MTASLKSGMERSLMSHVVQDLVVLLIACKVRPFSNDYQMFFFRFISEVILCLKLLKVLECVYINGTLL